MVTVQKGSDVQKLGSLIKGQKVAMVTTVEAEGSLRSRPMWTQQVDFDGDLWFFTRIDSGMAHEVGRQHRVNLSYSDPSDSRFISVSGTATVGKNPEKAKDLWNPMLKAWFPEGLEDPELALLQVSVEKAEYWDNPSGRMVQLLGFAKAVVTGMAAKPGGHGELHLQK